MVDDVKSELRQKWSKLVVDLFNGAVPEKAEWTRPEDMAAVLNAIASPVNHLFYPDGGGNDIRAARITTKGELEWSVEHDGLDRFVHVGIPLKLTFWSPGPYDHEAHFLLELGALDPVGEPVTHGGYAQELTELRDGTFAPRSVWDEEDNEGARLVVRYTQAGRFVIFGKGSLYNSFRDKKFDAYDAYHNDAAAFEAIVTEMAKIKV